MDLAESAALLRKIRINQLEPDLRNEVLEFAGEMGYEGTVNASSRLHILLDIYNAEKAKEKKSKRMLRKAENLIMKLAGLHYAAAAMEARRAAAQKKERPFGKAAETMELFISPRMKSLFESIGIRDERVMQKAVGLYGEHNVEGRIGLVQDSTLGRALVQKLFGMKPDIMLENDAAFVLKLDVMEGSKSLIDKWCRLHKVPIEKAVYQTMPQEIFRSLRSLGEVYEIVKLEEARQREAAEKAAEREAAARIAARGPEKRKAPVLTDEDRRKPVNYRPQTLRKQELDMVLNGFGFHYVTDEGGERKFRNAEGEDLIVSHRQHEYEKELVGKIIGEKGLKTTPEEFERVKRKLKVP